MNQVPITILSLEFCFELQWQESDDLGERRRIRERMFKVRQARLQMITQDEDGLYPDDTTRVARLSGMYMRANYVTN